jgi:trehalose utilization protein
MKYSPQQMNTIVRSMTSGIHGSFAARIGDAYMVADTGNMQTLTKAFSGLFDRVARYNDIEPEFDEAKHEAFIERLIDRVDKKLMQGHISQAEYEVMMSTLLKDATV